MITWITKAWPVRLILSTVYANVKGFSRNDTGHIAKTGVRLPPVYVCTVNSFVRAGDVLGLRPYVGRLVTMGRPPISPGVAWRRLAGDNSGHEPSVVAGQPGNRGANVLCGDPRCVEDVHGAENALCIPTRGIADFGPHAAYMVSFWIIGVSTLPCSTALTDPELRQLQSEAADEVDYAGFGAVYAASVSCARSEQTAPVQ